MGTNMELKAPERLEPHHLLESFDCGIPSLNDWLKRRARMNEREGASRSYVVCAGQESVKDLMPKESDKTLANYHIIGGAKLAAELDAKRASREVAEIASKL